MKDLPLGHDRMALAAAAALAVVVIAILGAIAGYIDNYYTESVAQYLRRRVHHQLQQLSLRFTTTRTGRQHAEHDRPTWPRSRPLRRRRC